MTVFKLGVALGIVLSSFKVCHSFKHYMYDMKYKVCAAMGKMLCCHGV